MACTLRLVARLRLAIFHMTLFKNRENVNDPGLGSNISEISWPYEMPDAPASVSKPISSLPYFQEGYMPRTPDITTDFDNEAELDFRNRLIAKFAIQLAKHFWNAGFEATPRTALYPLADRVEELCQEVITETQTERATASKLGLLVVQWGKLEERLLPWGDKSPNGMCQCARPSTSSRRGRSSG